MKKLKYVLLGALISAVVATSVVVPTIAWLSSASDEVVNTFEGGEITVTIDEAPVDGNGKRTDGDRVTGNNYKFVAGSVLDKDPTPTIKKGSVKSYVFVCVENENSDVFSLNINDTAWLKVAETGGKTLYAYSTQVDASQADADVVLTPVFTQVTVSEDLTSERLAELKAITPRQFIKSQAFAIQAEAITKNTAIDKAVEQFGLTGSVNYVEIA